MRTPTPMSASPRRKEKVIAPRRKSVSVTVKEEPSTLDSTSSTCASPVLGQEAPRKRRKAPPIEYFSAEDPEILLDDWLPTVERAAKWNGWNEEEHLMQLEGHLKGKALQEWTLMSKQERSDMGVGTAKLRERIDPVNPFVAVQEFPSPHASEDGERERLHPTRRTRIPDCSQGRSAARDEGGVAFYADARRPARGINSRSTSLGVPAVFGTLSSREIRRKSTRRDKEEEAVPTRSRRYRPVGAVVGGFVPPTSAAKAYQVLWLR